MISGRDYSWPTRAMAEKAGSSIRFTCSMMATPASFTSVWAVVVPRGRGNGAQESENDTMVGKTRFMPLETGLFRLANISKNSSWSVASNDV